MSPFGRGTNGRFWRISTVYRLFWRRRPTSACRRRSCEFKWKSNQTLSQTTTPAPGQRHGFDKIWRRRYVHIRNCAFGFIRDLIAALDNAEAVPIGDRHERYVVHAFGDRAVEVARLTLSSTDVTAIFANEIAARTEAAAEMASLNRSAEAEGLAAQAAIIKDYTSPI